MGKGEKKGFERNKRAVTNKYKCVREERSSEIPRGSSLGDRMDQPREENRKRRQLGEKIKSSVLNCM